MATPQERKFAFSYVERGKQFVTAKQYPEALEALREAVRLDPTSVTAWVTLALTHYRLREYYECLGAADEALKYDSANRDGWNFRGLALLALGRPAEAFMQFVHGANLYPSGAAFPLNAGSALHELRRYDLAITWAEHALTVLPYYPLASINRAFALIMLERYEEAEAQLANVSAAASHLSSFWAVRGSLHTRHGDYDEALAAIKRAIDLSDDEDDTAVVYERMGELLIALEDYTKALEVAEHGLELCPHSYDGLMLKAKALRGLGRESEAEEIERAVQARLAEQLALLDQAEGA
jgi:tetratricopeptide (TPR) repeat protein